MLYSKSYSMVRKKEVLKYLKTVANKRLTASQFKFKNTRITELARADKLETASKHPSLVSRPIRRIRFAVPKNGVRSKPKLMRSESIETTREGFDCQSGETNVSEGI